MAQVIWTEIATKELIDVGDYLENYSVKYASLPIQRFYDRTTQLASFPQMGRIIPKIDDNRYRELVEGNYSRKKN